MRPYEFQPVSTTSRTYSWTLEARSDVLERVVGLTVLSLVWGLVLFLAVTAALN